MSKGCNILTLTGFDLTFIKLFMSFLNKNNRETEFKCCPAWLGDEDIFQSSLPKIALNRFFFFYHFIFL